MKFIHTADLHLGYDFSSSYPPHVLEKLKENQFILFSNLIQLANNRNCGAIFIAGDLFDSNKVSEQVVQFVIREFEKFKGNIFICCGNHDPYTHDSVYLKYAFPKHVHIFHENIEKVSFEDCHIYGFSFIAPHKNTNSICGFRVEDQEKINIMVAHGDLKADSFYNPMPLVDIENSHLDYMALGHIHIEEGIQKKNQTFFAYCGTPQANTFKEAVNTGILLGEITKGSLQTEKIDVSCHQFLSLKVNISGSLSHEDAKEKVLFEVSKNDLKKTLFKIELIGSIKEEVRIDALEIEEYLNNICFYAKVTENYTVSYNLELLKKEQSIRGEFVRTALNTLQNESEEFILKVIEYGVKHL